jgi:hypothetical protein
MLSLESRIVRRVAKRVCLFVCVPFLLEAGWLIAAETESHTDWSDGNVLHAGSTSPDGQFGIVVPKSEEAGSDDATPPGQRSGMIIERINALEVFLW